MASSGESEFDADSAQRWDELYYASGSDKATRYVLLISGVKFLLYFDVSCLTSR